MAYYAAILHMLDPVKNQEVRSRHIAYLEQLQRAGKVWGRGPFADGSGGLVVYIADSWEEARQLAESDPHVREGSRKLDLREWQAIL
ncbi:YciI family protein [Brevibacillus massiliensis]|jgi:hypothetical protein|uniref:YciI family protein n=1 Tax=Brevibacillus massiliensis TaxID=1118054 RepID=UPI0002F3CF43|nr:YciI family protein [Brevibacillus massiliensis]